jgi:hypothetical protein
VGGLQDLFVPRQGQLVFHEVPGLLFMGVEGGEQEFHVAVLEVVGGLLHLVLVEHVAVADARGIFQVEHVVHALQVHGQALQTVGDLAGDGLAVDAAHLLEVGELGHFHAVQPDFPAQAPGAQGGVFPVVLDEADVVLLQVETQGFQGTEIQLQDVLRRRLQHHLELVIVLQAVRVLAVAAVLGPAAGLHVGGLPGLGAEGAQEGGGVAGAGADFEIVGLQQRATLLAPEFLEREDDVLESGHGLGEREK